MPFIPRIRILDSVTNTYANLEMNDYAKYLGLMIDSNLSWKYQYIEHHPQNQQVNRNHSQDSTLCPASCFTCSLQLTNCTLLNLWICAWGNCALKFQRKIVILQKRPYVLFTSVSLRNTPYPSFSNRIAFPYLAYFLEIVAIYCMISTDRQYQLVYSISLLNEPDS